MRETHDVLGESRQIGCTMSQRARSGLFRRAAFGLVVVGVAALGVAGCGTDFGVKDKAILNRFEAISGAKQIVVGRADRVEAGNRVCQVLQFIRVNRSEFDVRANWQRDVLMGVRTTSSQWARIKLSQTLTRHRIGRARPPRSIPWQTKCPRGTHSAGRLLLDPSR